MNQQTVLVFGTFDKLHPGHENFLEQAKQQGNYLIVVVAKDKNVLKLKGKQTINSEQERLRKIKANKSVDQALLGLEDYSKRYSLISEIDPDVICIGYDQAIELENIDKSIQIKKLDPYYPEKYKSSLL